MKYQYTNSQVQEVSDYIQKYMAKNSLELLSADECAELLNDAGILPNSIGPKPGFNFREMLRQGRDGKINLVHGAKQQKPKARWKIIKVEKDKNASFFQDKLEQANETLLRVGLPKL